MISPPWRAYFDLTRSIGLLQATEIVLITTATSLAPAMVLSRGHDEITLALWLAFAVLGLALINDGRMFWVGDLCGRGASSRWMRVHELWRHRWTLAAIYLGQRRVTWKITQVMGQAVAALDPFGLLAEENGGGSIKALSTFA